MQPILSVDLSSGVINELEVPQAYTTDYLGGASLAARLLYQHLTMELDPLSPEAPLLFLSGPLTGTAGPAVGRFVVCAKSPATGLWGESNCGGFWGPELRMAGYIGLWVTGKADHPVYLSIQDNEVNIHDARHFWGMETYQTQAAIKAELGSGGFRVLVIGPAGEARIPFAIVLTDHGRVGGRTGMGAVMGAKKLKAVAVSGSGKVPVVDAGRYNKLRTEANRSLRVDTFSNVMRELGTASGAEYFDYLGEMPKRYFQSGSFDKATEVSGSRMAETILTGVSACHACVIACGRKVTLEDGMQRKGPEYETMAGFGPNLLISDLGKITLMGELCDRYGMDTISLSNTIGLVYKLFEQGVITPADTQGLVVKWGDIGAAEALIHKTARKEGMGEWIAQGSLALARHFGVEEEAVQVNGLEVPYHDPRGASGMALVYTTSPRGACHNQSDYFLVEIGQAEDRLNMKTFSPLGGAEKAPNVAYHQNWRTVFSSLVQCQFSNLEPDSLVNLVNAACGLDWTLEDFLLSGERGWNLKRVINNRLGLRRQNDRLPKAFMDPYDDNPPNAAGFIPDFAAMLAAYYQVRDWDWETGFPSRNKLQSLDLGFAAEELWKS